VDKVLGKQVNARKKKMRELRIKHYLYLRRIYFEGLQFGYPKCCVENYVRLMSIGAPPAITMDAIFGAESHHHGYVRCPKCRGYQTPHITINTLSKFKPVPMTPMDILERR